MKKNIIALAIASAIAAPVAMADAPTVYGQINVAMDSVTDKGMFTTDRDSRLGVKGSEDLGNGLKAIYQMEFGVKVGDAQGTISGRNAVVGLGGSFGTVLLGRHDTPMKMSQAKDLFGDSTYGDIAKKYVAGGLGVDNNAGETRADNVVAYVSPEFAGVKLVAAGVSGEKFDSSTSANFDKKSSLANAYSIAAMYGSTKEGLFLSAAYNSYDGYMTGDEATSAKGKAFTETRVSAQYAVGGLIASAMYQTFDDGQSAKGENEGTNVMAQVGYKMGAFMPKAKYSTVDYKNADKDSSAYGLGLDYAFGKKTTGYIEYISSDKNMQTASTSGGVTTYGTNGKAISAVSVGMVHKF